MQSSLCVIHISHCPGTPIPENIILLREGLSRFSLQPSSPASIESKCAILIYISRELYLLIFLIVLNTSLDEFYEKHAEIKTAEQWLEDNDFNSAVGDDAVADWMAR